MKKLTVILLLVLLPSVYSQAATTYPQPNITTYQGFFDYANSVTEDMFMNVGLIIFWVVAFMSMKAYETEKAFAAASFICLILSSFLRVVGLIDEYLLIIFLMASAFSVILLKKN